MRALQCHEVIFTTEEYGWLAPPSLGETSQWFTDNKNHQLPFPIKCSVRSAYLTASSKSHVFLFLLFFSKGSEKLPCINLERVSQNNLWNLMEHQLRWPKIESRVKVSINSPCTGTPIGNFLYALKSSVFQVSYFNIYSLCHLSLFIPARQGLANYGQCVKSGQ